MGDTQQGLGKLPVRITRALATGAVAALIAAGVAGTAAAAAGSTLYVGGTGCSDTASGAGSSSTPFCTISKAAAAATAGVTVLVSPGTYSEQITAPVSGAAGDPIVIKSAVRGAATITGGTHGFAATGKSHLTFDGFTITGTSGAGILLSGSSDITVSNTTITSSGHPAQGQTAAGVDVSDTTDSLLTGNTSDHNSDYGFVVSGTSTRVVLSRNEASFNAEGWQRNANGIDIVAAGNTVIGNVLHDNEDSGLQFYPGGDNDLAADNVSYNNGDHGIDDLNVTGTTLVGNSVYNNCTDGINVEGTSSHYTVENNISMDNAVNTNCAHGPVGKDGRGRAGEIGIYDSATTNTTVDYNVVYSTSGTDKLYQWGANGYTSLAAFHTASGQGAHDVVANPKFADATKGDLRLTAGSPGIDAANANITGWQSTDIVGNNRVDDPATPDTGTGPRTFDDRGAYEYQPAANGTAPTAALSLAAGGTALSVKADASASAPGATAIQSYAFDFGDNSTSGAQPAATASHTYASAGTYTVTVTVTDVDGLTATKSASIIVTASTPPSAALTVAAGSTALSVNADASASTAGSTAIQSYAFDFGDNTGSGSQASAAASHTYATAGTYTVTVTVTDTDGLSSTKTAPITVSTQASTISHVGAGPIAQGAVTASGTSVTLKVATGSHTGDALIVSVMLTSTTPGTVTVSDTQHNTYHYSSGSDVFDSSKHRTLIVTAYNTVALSTSDTITLTYPSASKYNVEVDEFTGLSALDQQTTASGAPGGTTFATGAVTTTANNELLFTAVGTNSGTAATFGSGWNALPPAANSSYRLNCAWQTVNSAASYTSSGTTTAQWGDVLDSFK